MDEPVYEIVKEDNSEISSQPNPSYWPQSVSSSNGSSAVSNVRFQKMSDNSICESSAVLNVKIKKSNRIFLSIILVSCVVLTCECEFTCVEH